MRTPPRHPRLTMARLALTALLAGRFIPAYALKLGIRDLREGETLDCHACRRSWPTILIDAKDATGSGDFERLECPACYGPHWCAP